MPFEKMLATCPAACLHLQTATFKTPGVCAAVPMLDVHIVMAASTACLQATGNGAFRLSHAPHLGCGCVQSLALFGPYPHINITANSLLLRHACIPLSNVGRSVTIVYCC